MDLLRPSECEGHLVLMNISSRRPRVHTRRKSKRNWVTLMGYWRRLYTDGKIGEGHSCGWTLVGVDTRGRDLGNFHPTLLSTLIPVYLGGYSVPVLRMNRRVSRCVSSLLVFFPVSRLLPVPGVPKGHTKLWY